MKYKLFIAVILLLCLVPSLGMLLPRSAETGGNEVLARPPVLRSGEGKLNADYLPQLSSYIEDNYFFRQRLVTAWSAVNQRLLHTSIADGVVLGRDGWLYFSDTLNDYTGAETMSEREIYSAARNLSLMQEYCQSQGARFLFTIAPNKNSLYPEHMPDITVLAHPHDAERLAQALAAEGTAYGDLFAPFRQQEETLYFTQDSHWNSKGAALAADALNSALGRTSDYFAGPFTPEETHLSDLYAMLYPTGRRRETDYSAGLSFAYDAPIRSAENLTIMTTGGGDGSLLMFRDSFGNLLYPYMADSFHAALFSRSVPYKLDLIAQRAADTVIVELVERNLDYLIQNVPVMPAPERQAPAADRVLTDAAALERDEGQSLPGFVLLRGMLPAAAAEHAPVYFCAGGACWETFLLEDDGFGLYVPETALAAGSLTVVFTAEDGAVSVPVSAP